MTPFHTNYTKEITKSPAVLFTDLGLCNYAAGAFGAVNRHERAGCVFQNFMANVLTEHLRDSGWDLHCWRTADGAEVDFVIRKSNESVFPVEIKYTALREKTVRKSMRSFIKRYKPDRASVVNLGFEERIKIDSTEIHFIPFHKFIEFESFSKAFSDEQETTHP